MKFAHISTPTQSPLDGWVQISTWQQSFAAQSIFHLEGHCLRFPASAQSIAAAKTTFPHNTLSTFTFAASICAILLLRPTRPWCSTAIRPHLTIALAARRWLAMQCWRGIKLCRGKYLNYLQLFYNQYFMAFYICRRCRRRRRRGPKFQPQATAAMTTTSMAIHNGRVLSASCSLRAHSFDSSDARSLAASGWPSFRWIYRTVGC